MAIQAQERATNTETVTLAQEADAVAEEMFSETIAQEEAAQGYELGDATDEPAVSEASEAEQDDTVIGDAVDPELEAEVEAEAEDLEQSEQEAAEEKKEAPKSKPKKKSRGDRYKASAQRAWAKYEEQRAQFNEALLVANALKIQRDDALQTIEQLERELEDLGREITPQERELRDYKSRHRQQEIEQHLRQQMQQKEQEYAKEKEQEKLVDQMIEEANLLEEKYGVEADLILLRYTKTGGTSLESVAKQLSGDRKVAQGKIAKKQQALNKKAPRTGLARKGAAARTNTKRKPGDWEAMIEQATLDVLDWKNGR